jgi:hypothetical protein
LQAVPVEVPSSKVVFQPNSRFVTSSLT